MLLAVWFWLFTWVFWWLNAHMGVQGASPILATLALLSLPLLLRKRPSFSMDVIAFAAFMVWCVITTFWSPNAGAGLIVFDIENTNFAITSPALRLAITSLACGYAYWALHQLSDRQYKFGLFAMRAGLGIQIALMALWILAFQLVFDFASSVTDQGSAIQNMIRIVNITVLTVPLIAVSLPVKQVLIKWIAGAIMMAGLATLTLRPGFDASAALLAIGAVACTAIAGVLFGRQVYRLLGAATALAVMGMPLAVKGLFSLLPQSADLSTQARLSSWDYVLEKIMARPITGWGVEASKTWDETHRIIAPNGTEVDFRIVPSHPHNGALQIWAETGLIGALLVSIFVVLLGDRLARTCSSSKQAIIAGASLWGGGLVYAAISYNVWNDAFWATFLFVGTGVLAVSRTYSAPLEASAR